MRDDPPCYTFGDTPLAARRLELLSDASEASTRAFLTDAAPRSPRVALDLGCGPGASTRLVAETTGAQRTVGIDTSLAFFDLASGRPAPGVTFVRHDATTVPLPGAPADLVYCRLLLAHVPDPVATVRVWASQLAPGVDSSSTRWSGSTRLTRTWRDDPHLRERHPSDRLDDLARDLGALAESAVTDPVVWAVRQVAYERDAWRTPPTDRSACSAAARRGGTLESAGRVANDERTLHAGDAGREGGDHHRRRAGPRTLPRADVRGPRSPRRRQRLRTPRE